MAKKKITQKEAIFYHLYKNFLETPTKFIPVFEFMGEIYVKEYALWGFVSHECSARASEMKRDNPDLLESTVIVARSKARYYAYRLNPDPTKEMIKDEKLKEFHATLKKRMT